MSDDIVKRLNNLDGNETQWSNVWEIAEDAADEIIRLRAALAAALDAAATEKTLREHETKRANDNYASLTKHWLNESKLRELLTEIVEYNGGAGHALADEYVVARIKEEIRGE